MPKTGLGSILTWIVVVLVVQEDPLLDDDLFLGVADVDQPEGVVGNLESWLMVNNKVRGSLVASFREQL